MNWETISEDLRAQAQKMHDAREVGLGKCRQLTQTSAKCIRHIHRHQFEESARLLEQAKGVANEAREALRPYGALYFAGYLHDAEKELVEASAVYAIVHREPFRTAEDLGVGIMAYLNGMGEAASECRRFALDEMRAGRLREAAEMLDQMDAIYEELITFDYSDAMTGGLRRTCDALRAVIERTRSDLTATVSQQELIQELRATRGVLSARKD
jgi:translin